VCGITGYLTRPGRHGTEELGEIALRMAATMAHRGPDDHGAWVDGDAGLALAHRRLSIVDLSAAGHQPMVSANGRFVMSFNGEIYNFIGLRGELESLGYTFNGHSDTEVLLAGIDAWGVEETLVRGNGMLAFALWDRQRRELTLARDRVGKKPLYYGWCGPTFVFASELKAIRTHPDFAGEIDRGALGQFIRYGWVPAPATIFAGVRKLPAGSMLTLRADAALGTWPEARAFWSAISALERGARHPFQGSFEDAVDRLDGLLDDAVRCRMIADVPLGALLSGGLDSTTVVALMQRASSQPVKTFAIGFGEAKFNEAPFAREIARHLGTEHTELVVTPDDALAVIPDLPRLYDEPFADYSQIPTFLVSRLARSRVTVALTGDGGDEVFGGYTSYADAVKRWQKIKAWPSSVRRPTARVFERLAAGHWRRVAGTLSGQGPLPQARRRLGARLQKRGKFLPADNVLDLFLMKKQHTRPGSGLVRGEPAAAEPRLDPLLSAGEVDPVQAMMYLDFAGYMVDDILVKVDRASMGVSLEVRCPLLDWRVVEFAWSLPIAMRWSPSQGKRVLKEVLARYVPNVLTDRPKAGFSVPIESWLRGPLRDWAAALLDGPRLAGEGFLDRNQVRAVWQQHLSGWLNHDQLLWNILMFQAWLEDLNGRREVPAPLSALG
jgi:asparagine synthase (glutamine-hydrolysing)